jgi:hypothetical protein
MERVLNLHLEGDMPFLKLEQNQTLLRQQETRLILVDCQSTTKEANLMLSPLIAASHFWVFVHEIAVRYMALYQWLR